MLRTDFTRSLFTLLDITWALSTAVCTSWSSIDLLRTEFIGDFLKLQSFKAMKKFHREHLCQYCTSSSCPSRPRTFIKNEHLSRAFLRTLGNVGLTGEYVWPLELKKQSHCDKFDATRCIKFVMLFRWWSFVYIPAWLTNSSLLADSKSNTIEQDNETPFPLGSKNRLLVAIYFTPPPPFPFLSRCFEEKLGW